MVPSVAYYVIPTILILIGIRKIRERSWGRCNNRVKLNRKVVIVTGANSGIGYEVAKELARKEAQVIMACRNLDEAAKAVCRIKRELNCCSVVIPMELDLASVRSIKDFAEEIHSTYSAVHVLVNNAGVSYPDDVSVKTNDGFEVHIGVNHLGHFLLTNLLLDMLKKSENGRVVVVSSTLHEKGKIHLDDLNLEKLTEKTNAYANSKLANIYFSKQLARLTAGTCVTSYAVCPGWVYTNLFRHHRQRWYKFLLIFPIAYFFMRTPYQGAQTILYCATQPEIEESSGSIYRNCRKYTSKVEFDPLLAKQLWDVSENMIKAVDSKLTQKGLNEVPLL